MSKHRDNDAPWAAEIRTAANGLDTVIRKRLAEQGEVTFEEVMEGANAKRGTVRRLFDRLVNTGKAVSIENGIRKVAT